jgi:hypothetical protein
MSVHWLREGLGGHPQGRAAYTEKITGKSLNPLFSFCTNSNSSQQLLRLTRICRYLVVSSVLVSS